MYIAYATIFKYVKNAIFSEAESDYKLSLAL